MRRTTAFPTNNAAINNKGITISENYDKLLNTFFG